MKTKILLVGCALVCISMPVLAQQDQSVDQDQDVQASEEDSNRERSENRGRERHDHRDRHDENFNYSYLELSSLGYDMDVCGIDIEPDGYKLKLSLSLGDSLFGVVDRRRTDGKLAGANYEFDTEGYGFGLRGDSWFASYTYNTWDVGNAEFDVDTIRLGFRNNWTDRLEFNASYSWNNIEDADNDDGFQAGFAYELFDGVELIAEYETIGGHLDIDYFSAGVRLNF